MMVGRDHPLFDRDGIRLYQGDSRGLLPALAPTLGPFCIVSDPPYGIGFVIGSAGPRPLTGRARPKGIPIAGDDRPFDPSWMIAAAPGGVALFGADRFYDNLPPGGAWVAWDKAHTGGGADDFCDGEFAWVYPRKRLARNVVRVQWKGAMRRKAGEPPTKLHVSQKPAAVMAFLIGHMPAGMLVVDPYAGSGSTLVAAHRMGVPSLGIEIDPANAETARKRLEDETDQFRLPSAPIRSRDGLLARAELELMGCIRKRGTPEATQGIGQTMGEMDWACEIQRMGGKLPPAFYEEG